MSVRNLLWILLKLLLLQLCSSQVQLHYGLFTAGPSGEMPSSGVVPAIQLAEEMVNNYSSLLSNYTLSHTGVVDTMCDRARSLHLFLDAMAPSNPTMLGLIGCGCSTASVPVAELVNHYSISQISYISTSVSAEKDPASFPNFFRTIPSDAGFARALVSVVRSYGWKRVAFLTQRKDLFAEALSRFSRQFKKANVTLENRDVSQRKISRSLNVTNFFFEQENYRVFFLNTYSSLARQILCEAYKRGLTQPRYVWITYGWYQDKWWTTEVNNESITCTDQEMTQQVERVIVLQLSPEARDPEAMTDTGLTANQFEDLYRERLWTRESQDSNYHYTFAAPLAYDSLWALAFALHHTAQLVANSTTEEVVSLTGCNETGGLVPLEEFTYENEQMGCVIRWHIKHTDFLGVSGPVRFDRKGSRVYTEARILQYRADGSTLSLSLFARTTTIKSSTSNISYVSNETIHSVFPDGVPSDGRPYTEERTFYLELVVVYYTLATLGLIFCTVCLTFNCSQRNKKVVRLTSPGLNYLLLTGIYIIYASIFIRVLPSTHYTPNAARCSTNIILTNLGYCLTFGTLLVKMGRVYYIFHNPSTSKKALKDWHLALIILVIAGVGALLGILQVGVTPLRIDAVLREDPGYGVGTDEGGVEIRYVTYQCDKVEGGYGDVWLVLSYVYFGLLQVIGIILAIQTRKVHVKVLNDSKYIAALIYISSILLLLLALVVYTFNSYINVSEIVFSGAFLTAATIFLCLIFIPKMVRLYRDPKGEKIFDGSHRETSVEGTLSGGRSVHAIHRPTIDSQESDSGTIAQLQLRVRELEQLIRQTQMVGSTLPLDRTGSSVQLLESLQSSEGVQCEEGNTNMHTILEAH